MKKIIPIIFILCMIAAWLSIVNRMVKQPQEYANTLATARTAYEQGYYLEAQSYLNQANEMQEVSVSYEARCLQRDILEQNGSSDEYEAYLKKMIELYPNKIENYEKLMYFYKNAEKINLLYGFIPKYLEVNPEDQEVIKLKNELEKYYIYHEIGYYDVTKVTNSLVSIQEVPVFDEEQNEKKKLVNSKGRTILNQYYNDISVSQDMTSCFICDLEGNWKKKDIADNLLAKNDSISFERIYSLATNDIAVAIVDGKYRFINGKMKIADQTWDEALTFYNNISAVRNGERWALVTSETWSGELDYCYTDIPKNSLNCCNTDGNAVAVSDSTGYYVYDVENNVPVSDERFEELKAFESNQPTAYRADEKWGYVNRHGKIYIEAQYEDAKPFVNGYAAVKQNGLWGFIDANNEIIIEPQFQDTLDVMASGKVYVKNEYGYWDYIEIGKMIYTE